MSDTDRPQPRTAPAGVTDPLLWRLAAGVLEAHRPDEDGRCDNLLCDHQQWPCQPVRNAERALVMSGAEPERAQPPADDRQDQRARPEWQQRRSRGAAAA